jgi:hypothetical protein
MTQIRSEAEHLGSCTQTGGRTGPAECEWLVDRAAGMTSSWSACGGQVRTFGLAR